MIAHRLVVSYTTFSPLPRREPWRLFSSTSTYRRRQLPFSEVERPVLPGLSSRIARMPAADRNTAFRLQMYEKYAAPRLKI